MTQNDLLKNGSMAVCGNVIANHFRERTQHTDKNKNHHPAFQNRSNFVFWHQLHVSEIYHNRLETGGRETQTQRVWQQRAK